MGACSSAPEKPDPEKPGAGKRPKCCAAPPLDSFRGAAAIGLPEPANSTTKPRATTTRATARPGYRRRNSTGWKRVQWSPWLAAGSALLRKQEDQRVLAEWLSGADEDGEEDDFVSFRRLQG